MKRFVLVAAIIAFASVVVNAGDHGCCKGAATSADCKGAKTSADCKDAKKEAGCPFTSGTHAKVDSKLGNCPVSGEPASAKVSYVFEGTTYHFCCKDCIKDFKANPAKFGAKAKS